MDISSYEGGPAWNNSLFVVLEDRNCNATMQVVTLLYNLNYDVMRIENNIFELPVANAQHDPQAPWSFTSDIAYLVLQSIWGGKLFASPEPSSAPTSSSFPLPR